jgi:curli biogenesis system outer membrane secretion channel CsgG
MKFQYVGILGGLWAVTAMAASPKISVTSFSQEVNHVSSGCRSWDFTEQDQLRTELEGDLTQQGVTVLNRREIRNIYQNEFELPNMDRRRQPKRGRFLSAEFTITGGITELGVCEDSSGNGIELGGIVSLLGGPSGVRLRAGQKKSTSRVKLSANLVSVETGEIVHTFTASSEIQDSGYAVAGGAYGIGAAHAEKKHPPIEKASNDAVEKLAAQIAQYIHSNGA